MTSLLLTGISWTHGQYSNSAITTREFKSYIFYKIEEIQLSDY